MRRLRPPNHRNVDMEIVTAEPGGIREVVYRAAGSGGDGLEESRRCLRTQAQADPIGWNELVEISTINKSSCPSPIQYVTEIQGKCGYVVVRNQGRRVWPICAVPSHQHRLQMPLNPRQGSDRPSSRRRRGRTLREPHPQPCLRLLRLYLRQLRWPVIRLRMAIGVIGRLPGVRSSLLQFLLLLLPLLPVRLSRDGFVGEGVVRFAAAAVAASCPAAAAASGAIGA
ncbi:hypothetical protein DFP72DRAFT_583839 [Ephemerocybe angulata]|uniref:Uncharacterized protein n=1 Tax=Ephemerocybe angulata TaxID=980116 RepID=A0A8H6HJ76_9AGAR|nr:hypothetical protein DFP72DRAFT_583839 [Tulosesus angulatus]